MLVSGVQHSDLEFLNLSFKSLFFPSWTYVTFVLCFETTLRLYFPVDYFNLQLCLSTFLFRSCIELLISMIFKKTLFFKRAVLGSQQNWETGIEIPHIFPTAPPPPPCHCPSPLPPAPCITSPLSTSLTRMVPLLQLMNLHWHIIITQSS